jgi:hypothetical protein
MKGREEKKKKKEVGGKGKRVEGEAVTFRYTFARGADTS